MELGIRTETNYKVHVSQSSDFISLTLLFTLSKIITCRRRESRKR